jgi:hypothetical protein
MLACVERSPSTIPRTERTPPASRAAQNDAARDRQIGTTASARVGDAEDDRTHVE